MSTQKTHETYVGALRVVEDAKKTKDGNPSKSTGETPEAATPQHAPKPAETKSEESWEGKKLVADPIPFKCFGKTTRIKLDRLGGLMHMLLRQKFHDLVGVLIEPYATRYGGMDFLTKLYFENNTAPLEEGEIKNLESMVAPIGEKVTGNMYDLAQIRSNRSIGKTYRISMETRQLLAPFMYGKMNNNHPKNKKWENGTLVREINTGAQQYQGAFYRIQNAERIVVEVCNFDVRELLRLLYGASSMVTETVFNDSDEVVNYQTNKTHYDIRYIKRDNYGTPIVNIEQFDKDEVDNIITAENPPIRSMTGSVYYYSAPDVEPRRY